MRYLQDIEGSMNFTEEVGIDLGTANVLIYIEGKGIVLQEPSVVAINRDTNEILAVGSEARRMIGRTPGNISAIRPLREGVISDYDVTERMLQYFIKKTCGSNRFIKPRIWVSTLLRPIWSPPGLGKYAFPKRARRGPTTITEPLSFAHRDTKSMLIT